MNPVDYTWASTTPPVRREHWHPDYFSWRWDARRLYRWRLHYAWKVVRCHKCGLRRHAFLRLAVERAWRQGSKWVVRSRVLHAYHKGEQILIEPPPKPALPCRCLAWAGPAKAKWTETKGR